MFRQVADSLQQIPGVRMVASALYAPMSGNSWNKGIRVEGRPEPGAKEDTGAGWARVTPGFFEALGAKIVLGRPITEEDTAATRKVAVINEAFAKRFFKDQNPIGQHFRIGKIKYSGTYEIVGVVRDMRYMTYDYKDPVGPMFWVPEVQTVQYDDPAQPEWRNLLALFAQHRDLGAGKPAGRGGPRAQDAGEYQSQSGSLQA